MKHSLYKFVFAVILVSAFVIESCGPKPPSPLPPDVSVSQVLAAIESYSKGINDLTGKASVKMLIDGDYKSATTLVRYIRPDNFRLYLKGFAGIDIARMKASKDSVIIYLPTENMYISTGRYQNISGYLMPEIGIGLKHLESVFSVNLPLPGEMDSFQKSLKSDGEQLQLSLKRKQTIYNYTVKGPDLLPVAEEMLVDNIPVWRKTVSKFNSSNGVVFPAELEIEHGEYKADIRFSECEINTGLTKNDLALKIPASAERMIIEKNE